MKIKQTLALFIALLLFHSIQASQTETISSTWPANCWDSEIYANALLSDAESYPLQGTFGQAIERSQTMTKKSALENGITLKEAVFYDWLSTLDLVEKKLLSKPFSQWSLDDLTLIAASLTRLTDRKPGAFRTDDYVSCVQTITLGDQINARVALKRIFEEKGDNPSIKDLTLAYPVGSHYIHPDPADVLAQLTVAFKVAQKKFILCTALEDVTERKEECARIGATFAYALFYLRPYQQPDKYEGAHKRLALVIMNVLLIQAGFSPVPITNRALFINLIRESLAIKSNRPIVYYWQTLVTVSSRMVSTPVKKDSFKKTYSSTDDVKAAAVVTSPKKSAVQHSRVSDTSKLCNVVVIVNGESTMTSEERTVLKEDAAALTTALNEVLGTCVDDNGSKVPYSLLDLLGISDHRCSEHQAPESQAPESEACESQQAESLPREAHGGGAWGIRSKRVELPNGMRGADVFHPRPDGRNAQSQRAVDLAPQFALKRAPLKLISAACACCATKKLTTELKRCSACHKVYYCNRTCQNSDWKNHKLYCNARE